MVLQPRCFFCLERTEEKYCFDATCIITGTELEGTWNNYAVPVYKHDKGLGYLFDIEFEEIPKKFKFLFKRVVARDLPNEFVYVWFST